MPTTFADVLEMCCYKVGENEEAAEDMGVGEGLQQASQTRGLLMALHGLHMWVWSLRYDGGCKLFVLLGARCCPHSVMYPG